MSLTLGEKLRQAREERGFTLSEVAEQTRISSLYLESIENDDYRILPGGIFNKGFVKSFAKFVGVNEQEALSDYAQILAASDISQGEELKLYKPEVLTDDRSYGSMTPTIIFAVVILALMTGGVYFFVSWMRQPSEPVANTTARANANTATATPANTETPPANVPDMATLKVEFRALTLPVSLSATNDGAVSSNVVIPGTAATFEPKTSLKLSYSRSLASAVALTINGKTISLPAVPLNPRRNAIEFEINKDNIAQIWTSGAISTDVPAASPSVDANVTAVATNTVPAATATPVRPEPRPSAAANTAPTPVTRPAETPKPAPATPRPSVANRP